MKWEYRQIDANMFFERQMKCGDDGWELVSVSDGIMYFKRLKSPNENYMYAEPVSSGNVGRTITHFYCDGKFGRDYDMAGSVIVAEGAEWIVIRKLNGIIAFASFQCVKYLRDETGFPSESIITGLDDKQDIIDRWCTPNESIDKDMAKVE